MKTKTRSWLILASALTFVAGCGGGNGGDDGRTDTDGTGDLPADDVAETAPDVPSEDGADVPADVPADDAPDTAETPTVTLSADPGTVPPGGTSTLSWSSQDADACSASGGWSGSKATSGSEAVGPLSATTDFTLTCTGPGGSAAQTATVTVTGGAEATLWVNGATGSDTHSRAQIAAGGGSLQWATIGRAAWGSTDRLAPNPDEAAQPGDVVSIAAGTYNTGGTSSRNVVAYNPANSGTATDPITFQADGTVILGWSDAAPGPLIGADSGRDYIVWRGFTITEDLAHWAADTGPVYLGTNHCMIDRCVIHGGGTAADDNHCGVRIEGGRYPDVPTQTTGNVVSNCIIDNFFTTNNVTNGTGIMTYDTVDFVLEHNEIYNCGSGINLKHGQDLHGTVRYNTIHDTTGVGIRYANSPVTQVLPTFIHQNLLVSTGAAGIQIGGGAPVLAKVVNNTIVDGTWGVYVRTLPSDAVDHEVWNNIIADGTEHSAVFESATYLSTGVGFEHNGYHGSPFDIDVTGGGGNMTLSTWQTTYGHDSATPASDTADPAFVDPSAGDYHLQAESPARDAAVDLLDLDGDGSTTDLIHRGCYATGTEVMGPP